MSEPNFDVARAHRWFAVEFNNAAWELVEKASRSAGETQQMLHLSHAAALHWQNAGAAINQERAELLLASAYLAADELSTAQRHVELCLAVVAQKPPDESPFDRAAGYACAAKIYRLLQDDLQAQRFDTLSDAAAASLDAEDAAMLARLYR